MLRRRLFNGLTYTGVGGLLLGGGTWITQGGLFIPDPVPPAYWLGIAMMAVGAVLVVCGILYPPKTNRAKRDSNEAIVSDIRNDFLKMNTLQRELANCEPRAPYSYKLALQVHKDFVSMFGGDAVSFASSLVSQVVSDRDVTPLVRLLEKFGEIADKNDCGLKTALESNHSYGLIRSHLASRRLQMKTSRRRNTIIQNNIDTVGKIIYGLNSMVILRSVFKSATPGEGKDAFARLFVVVEGIEASAERTLNTMLGDLESEWKVSAR